MAPPDLCLAQRSNFSGTGMMGALHWLPEGPLMLAGLVFVDAYRSGLGAVGRPFLGSAAGCAAAGLVCGFRGSTVTVTALPPISRVK